MPRPKSNASEPLQPENPIQFDEDVDLHEEYYNEEEMDENFEFEEITEEIEKLLEIEEQEEEGGVDEEEEEGEVQEEEEEEKGEGSDVNNANRIDNRVSIETDKEKLVDEDEKNKHAELLTRPPRGATVYIGCIPHDTSEEELRSFCESVGEVMEVQIMKGKDSIGNKGFAFVTFRSVELAFKAIDELHNTEFKSERIKCATAPPRNQLFLGNIPRSWSEEDLKRAVTAVGPGVTVVKLVKDVKNYNNNKGFAFIDYYNRACAEYSRQKMMNPNFKLGNNAPTVSWADPKKTDSAASLQVKTIYVKNLPSNVTEDQLNKLFEHFGKIMKVDLPVVKSGLENHRFAFIQFADRSSAMKALNNGNKYKLDGQLLECSLAKPRTDQKSVGGSNAQKSVLLPSYPPPLVDGLVGSAYGALGAGYDMAGFVQPLIHVGAPGMAMMPMLLPNGAVGYILQQPGLQPYLPQQRDIGRGSNRYGSSSMGREGGDGNQRHRYQPY